MNVEISFEIGTAEFKRMIEGGYFQYTRSSSETEAENKAQNRNLFPFSYFLREELLLFLTHPYLRNYTKGRFLHSYVFVSMLLICKYFNVWLSRPIKWKKILLYMITRVAKFFIFAQSAAGVYTSEKRLNLNFWKDPHKRFH